MRVFVVLAAMFNRSGIAVVRALRVFSRAVFFRMVRRAVVMVVVMG